MRGGKVEKEVEEGSRMSLRKMIEMIMRRCSEHDKHIIDDMTGVIREGKEEGR